MESAAATTAHGMEVPAVPDGTTGYEGPGTSYSDINSDGTGGVVNFAGGLPPGQSGYFSLEEPLTGIDVAAGGPGVLSRAAPQTRANTSLSAQVHTPLTALPVRSGTPSPISRFQVGEWP